MCIVVPIVVSLVSQIALLIGNAVLFRTETRHFGFWHGLCFKFLRQENKPNDDVRITNWLHWNGLLTPETREDLPRRKPTATARLSLGCTMSDTDVENQ